MSAEGLLLGLVSGWSRGLLGVSGCVILSPGPTPGPVGRVLGALAFY